MKFIQELLTLAEDVTPEQANAAIKKIVDDFSDYAENIFPNIDEWEREIKDTYGDDPSIQVFKDEVERYLDSYLDHFMEFDVTDDDREMFEYVTNHMRSDIVGAIAGKLKANYKLSQS